MLAYVILLSAVVGFLQRDDWPFSSYHILVGRASVTRPVSFPEFFGLDANGGEWKIDAFSWSPASELTIQLWVDRHLNGLTPAARDHALQFLLDRAEAGRQALAEGRPIGFERRLGVLLSAPHWWLPPRARAVPSTPYVGLRIYRVTRVPVEMVRDRTSLRMTLIAEYRRR